MVPVIEFVFGLVGSILGGLFEFLQSIFISGQSEDFNAHFIEPSEAGLSRWNKGFSFGNKALTQEASFRNAYCSGMTGSGKSSGVLIPSCISISRGNASVIINDVSGGELEQKTSGLFAHRGYEILRLDANDPSWSQCFNPLARCHTISDIERVVHLLLTNTVGETKGDPFWNTSATMLISIFARYLVFHAPEYNTFHNVQRMLETFSFSPQKIDALIVRTHEENLISAYKSMVASGDKTLASIVSTAKAALKIFSDPTIAQVTSFDTIDFASLRNQKVALYVASPISQVQYYKPITALFFGAFFQELLSKIPSKDQNAVFCLLDEAGSFKLSEAMSVTISNIRKFRAGMLVCVQDYQNLVALYGASEAHNIKTNTYAQAYLPGQPIIECRTLETTFGRFTYTDEKDVKRTRPLMTADEIRQSEAAFLLIGNKAPVKMKLKPYYKDYGMRRLASLPPVSIAAAASQQSIPLIPLD